MTDSPLVVAALEYAGRGWRVFPVHAPTDKGCSCGKPNCDAIGKHSRIRAWPNVATTDGPTINEWWKKWPDANVGIATGAESRLLVLDVDNKNGKDGNATLEELCCQYDWHPDTFTVTTASGRHLYFEHPDGKVPGGTCALGQGLDVQGDGKCVIAPPSLHATGRQYRCEDSSALVEPLPEPILALVRNTSEARNRKIVESRNVELTSIAGQARRYGATESELQNLLLKENRRSYDDPLSRDEVLTIAQSVARYKPAPLNLPWMPLQLSDWDGSLIVKQGTSSERGMYASLIVETWRQRGVLPDDARLWKLAQADDLEQFERAREFVLSEFESGELDGRQVLVHPRIVLLWEKQAQKYAQTVEAGRKSGASRRTRKYTRRSPKSS